MMLLTTSEMLSVTLFREPTVPIMTLKMHTNIHDPDKSYCHPPETHNFGKLTLHTLRDGTHSTKKRVSGSISELIPGNFITENEKLYLNSLAKRFSKALTNISAQRMYND